MALSPTPCSLRVIIKTECVQGDSKWAEEILQASLLAALVVLSHEDLAETLDDRGLCFCGRLGGSGARCWNIVRNGGSAGRNQTDKSLDRKSVQQSCKPYFYIYNHFAAHICSICYAYHLGVLVGVLFFPGGLGVVVLDFMLDWGVLCLPALPGGQWVLAKVDRKSLFTPLCLVVLLQAWQVAIWENNKSNASVRILIIKIVLAQQSDAWSTANGARWGHWHSPATATVISQLSNRLQCSPGEISTELTAEDFLWPCQT